MPWDQHSALKLFQPQELKTELALFALESLSRPSSTLQKTENCANTPAQSFGQPEYNRCKLMWSWDDLYAGHANKSISFRMGTVGKWMVHYFYFSPACSLIYFHYACTHIDLTPSLISSCFPLSLRTLPSINHSDMHVFETEYMSNLFQSCELSV